MNEHSKPITEADLHAYVDGRLESKRRLEVEHYLTLHPETVKQVDAYQEINQGLHQLFDPVLEETPPLTSYKTPSRGATPPC